ncbi:MAG: type II secretion system F family protein [Candidatus Omnitrophota bacterium]
MPVFSYKAKKDDAATVTGEVTARDADEALDMVVSQGLLPVNVVEKGESSMSSGVFIRTVNPRQLHAFTFQLAKLLRSGIPLLRSLDVLSRQMRSSREACLAGIIRDMALNLSNGRSFSECLAEHSPVFPDIYVTMVRAGEESGRLKEILESLAVYERKQDEISRQVRSALVYPAFMLVVGIGTVFFILGFVMPKISVLFDGMRTALPWPTVCVMSLSRAIRMAWPAIFVLAMAGAAWWRFAARSPHMRRKIGAFWMGLPVIREFTLKTDMERFSRTLSLLLASGVPILKALETAVPALEHESLRREFTSCQERVAGGASFGACLRESACVPDMMAQIIAIGEETGELSTSLKDVADTYEQEIAETTRSATTLLEPLLILVVGLVVGFIVLAMLLPIFRMEMFVS